jgi:hypothetical protein
MYLLFSSAICSSIEETYEDVDITSLLTGGTIIDLGMSAKILPVKRVGGIVATFSVFGMLVDLGVLRI